MSKSSEGTVSSELTIAEVNWNDGGLYSCVAREVVDRGVDAAAVPKMQRIFLDVFSGAEVRNKKGHLMLNPMYNDKLMMNAVNSDHSNTILLAKFLS